VAQVVVTPEAYLDLDRITEFLAEAAPEAAPIAVGDIFDALILLPRHPLIGRRTEDDLRELVISRGAAGYVALYRYEPATGTIRVLRVRHQRESGFSD
jgi:plasmid stabilization system protein ParE